MSTLRATTTKPPVIIRKATTKRPLTMPTWLTAIKFTLPSTPNMRPSIISRRTAEFRHTPEA